MNTNQREMPTPGSDAYYELVARLASTFYSSRNGEPDTHGVELLQIIHGQYGGRGVYDFCAFLIVAAAELAGPGLRNTDGHVDLDVVLGEPRHPDEEAAVLAARAGSPMTAEGRKLVAAVGGVRQVIQEALALSGPEKDRWHLTWEKLVLFGESPVQVTAIAAVVFEMVEAIGRWETAAQGG